MKRRSAAKAIAITIPMALGCSTQKNLSYKDRATGILKPKRLSPGDTVGLISPGSSLSQEALIRARSNIGSLGFKVKTGENWDGQYGYLASRDADRLKDIHNMFADKEVAAIWCARGGYGCTRLLPYLDYNLIKDNPKILIGYNDITALLNAIYFETGLIGFHGPVASSEFKEYSIAAFTDLLQNPQSEYILSNSDSEEIEIIKEGRAKGRLVGGNLSILASMCGTPYQVDMKDKLVCIEDVGEKPYRIDRMLTQLLQSSGLAEAKGVILGVFIECEADEGDRSLSLRECLFDRLGQLNIPVALGYSFGHISEQFTIPIGVQATIDTSQKLFMLNGGSVT